MFRFHRTDSGNEEEFRTPEGKETRVTLQDLSDIKESHGRLKKNEYLTSFFSCVFYQFHWYYVGIISTNPQYPTHVLCICVCYRCVELILARDILSVVRTIRVHSI